MAQDSKNTRNSKPKLKKKVLTKKPTAKKTVQKKKATKKPLPKLLSELLAEDKIIIDTLRAQISEYERTINFMNEGMEDILNENLELQTLSTAAYALICIEMSKLLAWDREQLPENLKPLHDAVQSAGWFDIDDDIQSLEEE